MNAVLLQFVLWIAEVIGDYTIREYRCTTWLKVRLCKITTLNLMVFIFKWIFQYTSVSGLVLVLYIHYIVLLLRGIHHMYDQ